MKKIVPIYILVLFCFFDISNLYAQQEVKPTDAFIRSLVIPGWGHYYAEKGNWNRGKIHLGTEAVLIASFVGLWQRSGNLENRYITLAKLRAGVDITDKQRSFRIALAEFESLSAYNDYQLRSRNWNRLIDVTSQNNWNWQSREDREQFRGLRSKRDKIRNSLPAILSLMAVNRVIAAISAANRVNSNETISALYILPVYEYDGTGGAIVTLSFQF